MEHTNTRNTAIWFLLKQYEVCSLAANFSPLLLGQVLVNPSARVLYGRSPLTIGVLGQTRSEQGPLSRLLVSCPTRPLILQRCSSDDRMLASQWILAATVGWWSGGCPLSTASCCATPQRQSAWSSSVSCSFVVAVPSCSWASASACSPRFKMADAESG